MVHPKIIYYYNLLLCSNASVTERKASAMYLQMPSAPSVALGRIQETDQFWQGCALFKESNVGSDFIAVHDKT